MVGYITRSLSRTRLFFKTLKSKKMTAKTRMLLTSFSLSLYYLHDLANLFNLQFTILYVKDFLGHNLSIDYLERKKNDLFFTSGKILLKQKRMNIFFCIFLGQVERDEQIIVTSNNSNTK